MADRFAELGSRYRPDRQEGNFVVEIYETFHNHTASTGASSALSFLPGRFYIIGRFERALAMSGRTHYRFYNTRNANFFHRLQILLLCRGETIGRRRQAEFLGGKPTNPFTVHGEPCGTCGRCDIITFLLKRYKCGGRDCFDFRNDMVRLLFSDGSRQSVCVKHAENMIAVCYLHCRSVGITVACNNLNAHTLKLDSDFFAKFATSKKKCLTGGRCEYRSDFCH